MNHTSIRYLWLVLAAILMFFAGGRWNVPLAAWLAPVFAIRFYRESERAGRSFLLLWLASAVPAILSWQGATFLYFIHPVAEAAFFVLMTPLSLLPYVIDRSYYRRFSPALWTTLVYPIAATAVDFFSGSGSPFGTFGAAAYSQRGVLPVMQIASITGLWGITFVMGWCASLLNTVWDNAFKPGRAALTLAGLLVLTLGFGTGRTLLAPEPAQAARIAGFSLPEGRLSAILARLQTGDESGFRQETAHLHAQELTQIRSLAQQGAEIVTLQEGAGMGTPDQVEKLLADAGAIARDEQIYIVLPTFTFGTSRPENAVHIIDPRGEIALKHVKFGGTQFEGSLTGSGELQTLDTPYGRISAVVCWDADFPESIRHAGLKDVDLLFVPSNDWFAVRDIHAGMAAFRSVENGMTIYRQTGSGVSSVFDAYGRTLRQVDLFESESAENFAAVQMVSTPLSSVDTLYPRLGDVFGNLTLILSAGLLAGFFLIRRRPRAEVQPGPVSTAV